MARKIEGTSCCMTKLSAAPPFMTSHHKSGSSPARLAEPLPHRWLRHGSSRVGCSPVWRRSHCRVGQPCGFRRLHRVLAERRQYLVCAPDEHDHVATDGRIERTGHGRIDCRAAGRTEFSPECSHERGIAGGQIDPRFARTRCGERPFSPRTTDSISLGPNTMLMTTGWPPRFQQGVGFLCALGHEGIDRAFPDIVGDHRKPARSRFFASAEPILPRPITPIDCMSQSSSASARTRAFE